MSLVALAKCSEEVLNNKKFETVADSLGAKLKGATSYKVTAKNKKASFKPAKEGHKLKSLKFKTVNRMYVDDRGNTVNLEVERKKNNLSCLSMNFGKEAERRKFQKMVQKAKPAITVSSKETESDEEDGDEDESTEEEATKKEKAKDESDSESESTKPKEKPEEKPKEKPKEKSKEKAKSTSDSISDEDEGVVKSSIVEYDPPYIGDDYYDDYYDDNTNSNTAYRNSFILYSGKKKNAPRIILPRANNFSFYGGNKGILPRFDDDDDDDDDSSSDSSFPPRIPSRIISSIPYQKPRKVMLKRSASHNRYPPVRPGNIYLLSDSDSDDDDDDYDSSYDSLY